MKRTRSSQRLFILAILGSFAGLALLPIILGGMVYNQLYYRHVRAFQRWQGRQPYHYSYNLHFLGEVTYQSYQVEVAGGKLVRLTDLATGNTLEVPNTASSRFQPINAWIRNNLMINDMFIHIRGATRPPISMEALISRANPSFYQRLTASGWLPRVTASCDPAYPKVAYHPTYGFPEELFLAAKPCAVLEDYNYPVHLKIEAFQALP